LAFGWLLSLSRQKMHLHEAMAKSKDLVFLIRLVEDGSLKPVIDRT
jgi:hypothetical protein